MAGGGDVVPKHEGLGEVFAALEACAGASGADDGYTEWYQLAAEIVGQASHERVFGPDDDEVDGLLGYEMSDGEEVVRGQVDVGAYAGCAGVSRGDGEPAEAWALGHLPGQGVLASATADQQDVEVIIVRHCGVVYGVIH